MFCGAPPRTMILLNPDLEPDPVPDRARGNRSVLTGSGQSSRSQQLPSLRTLARFLIQAQRAVRLRGGVSVLLTTDGEIRRLNRQFRGIDKPTDVLSFPADPLPRPEKMAGDLAIGVPTARRQGIEQGHSLGTELKVLILHGLLHLAGYDHEADNGRMARREQRLRAQLGLPQGLIERAEQNRVPQVSLLRPGRQGTRRRMASTSSRREI